MIQNLNKMKMSEPMVANGEKADIFFPHLCTVTFDVVDPESQELWVTGRNTPWV